MRISVERNFLCLFQTGLTVFDINPSPPKKGVRAILDPSLEPQKRGSELVSHQTLVLCLFSGCAAWIETQSRPLEDNADSAATPAPQGVGEVPQEGESSLMTSRVPPAPPGTALRVALTLGGVYACVMFVFQRTSGGHANPAVTLAWLTLRRISIARAVLYFAAQVSGFLQWLFVTHALKLRCASVPLSIRPFVAGPSLPPGNGISRQLRQF